MADLPGYGPKPHQPRQHNLTSSPTRMGFLMSLFKDTHGPLTFNTDDAVHKEVKVEVTGVDLEDGSRRVYTFRGTLHGEVNRPVEGFVDTGKDSSKGPVGWIKF